MDWEASLHHKLTILCLANALITIHTDDQLKNPLVPLDEQAAFTNRTLDMEGLLFSLQNSIVDRASSAIFMPLMQIASIYGMNFHVMPELSWHYGYRGALRHGCLMPWANDPAMYAQVTITRQYRECEEEVLDTLQNLLKKRVDYSRADGEQFFITNKMPVW